MRDRSLALVSERWLWFVGERWFRGAPDRRVAVFAGSGHRGGVLWPLLSGGAGRRLLSACCGWELFELLEGGNERVGPRPVVLQAEFGAASGEREPGGDVQEPVADSLRLGRRQFAVERERLGPDDQVVREQHDLQPHLVELKFLERELGQAGVLVVADAVLDVGVLAVAALNDRDVVSGWSVRIAWNR